MGCKVSKDVENPTILGLEEEEEEDVKGKIVDSNEQDDGDDGEEEHLEEAEAEQSVELTGLDTLKSCFIEFQQAILEGNIVQDFLAKRDAFLEQVRVARSVYELAEHIKHLEVCLEKRATVLSDNFGLTAHVIQAHTAWESFQNSWNHRRDAWNDELSTEDISFKTARTLLIEFESNLKFYSTDDGWSQKRIEWNKALMETKDESMSTQHAT